MGMPTKNTIVVPCIVKNWLNVSGPRKLLAGLTNCQRIARASQPAITKNTIAISTYMMPIRL